MSRVRGNRPVRAVQDVNGIFDSQCRAAGAFDQHLRLVQDAQCKQPYTLLKAKTIHVPMLRPYWTEEMVRIWRGYTTHEIGHHAPEVQDAAPLLDELNINPMTLFFRVMNGLEDVRNEHNKRIQQFPGFAADLNWTQGYHCLSGARNPMTQDRSKLSPDSRLFCDLLGLVYRFRAEWQPSVGFGSGLWESLGYTSLYKFLPRLEPDKLVTAHDVYQLARDIFDHDPDHDAEEELEKAQQGEGEGQGEEGQPGGSKSEDSDSGEEGEGADAESQKSDEEGEEGGGVVSYKDLMSHSHGEDPKDGNGFPIKIIYDHQRANDYIPQEVNEYMMKDMDYRTPDPDKLKYYHQGRGLAGQARRLFQSRIQARVTHNHRAGRLDKRDLYRIPSGAQDVFKRKERTPDPKGTALYLLIDNSGSMSGMECEMTAAATTLLVESVAPLQLPVKVANFTSCHNESKHNIIKDWTENVVADELLSRFQRSEVRQDGNADGDSILYATRDILKRTEERKILIVMSDGQPASWNDGDCWTYTRDVVAQVSKHIECYGIGIMSDAVKDFYPEYQVLRYTHELEACLLNLIKTKIFKD